MKNTKFDKKLLFVFGVGLVSYVTANAATFILPSIAGQLKAVPGENDVSDFLTPQKGSGSTKTIVAGELPRARKVSSSEKKEKIEKAKTANKQVDEAVIRRKERERQARIARANAQKENVSRIEKRKRERNAQIAEENARKAHEEEEQRRTAAMAAENDLNFTDTDNSGVFSPEKKLKFMAGSQYASQFYFRGLDVLNRVSPENGADGITLNSVSLDFQDGNGGLWQAGFNYIQSLSSQLTNGTVRGQQPNLVDSSGRPRQGISNFEDYRINSKERYSESDFTLGYSRNLFGGLSGNVGVGHYIFSDTGWWGADSTTEITAGLSYANKYGSFSTNFTYDLDAFDGGFLEFGIAGRPISLWKRKNSVMELAVVPTTKFSYDFDYNGDNNGWNNIQFGLDFPLRLTKNLGLTLGANYSQDLGSANNDGSRRTDDGFWFTATLVATNRIWPHVAAAAPVSAGPSDPKSPVVELARDEPKLNGWRFSGGVSQRTLNSTFSSNVKPLVRATTLLDHKRSTGSRDLANGGEAVAYENGSVGAATGGRDGERGIANTTGGTRSGTFANRDEQLLFTSRLYKYPTALTRYEQQDEDEDASISPYVRMDYEIWRQGSLSLSTGLSYSFTQAELDTGTGLASLDHAYERSLTRYFLYAVDTQAGFENSTRVIVNDEQFRSNPIALADRAVNGFTDRSPQAGMQGSTTEKSKVATFVRSGLDADMHSVSLPFALTLDLGDRLHVSLEAGPTLNIFNYDLRTDAWSQRLSNTADPELRGQAPRFRGTRGIFASSDFREVDTINPPAESPSGFPISGAGTAGAANSPNAPAVATVPVENPPNPPRPGQGAPSSGKGGNFRRPALPGDTVASRVWREDGVRARFGAFAQLGIQYDLNDADTWFIDVWGRYDYVNSFTISNGITSAEIDPSAWSIGAGIGYRF